MLHNFIDLLQSDDPEERRQAIKEIARMKDPAALKPLAQVYRTDPDPEIRELAAKAGRYIKKNMVDEAIPYSPDPSAASGEPSRGGGFIDLNDRSTSESETSGKKEKRDKEKRPREITQRDRDRAAKYVDDAITFRTRGEDTRAIEMIVKALDTDPEQASKSMTINLAGALLNMPGVDAIDALRNSDTRETYLPGSSKSKRKSPDGDDPGTWGQVAVDLVIYAVVVMISSGAIFFMFQQQLIRLFSSESAAMYFEGEFSTESLQAFSTIGIVVIAGIAFAIGIASLIGMFLQNLFLHIAATMVLGGDGSYRGLFQKTMTFHSGYAIINAVFGIIYVLTSFQAISAVLVNPGATSVPGLEGFGPIGLLWMGISFGALFWFGKLIGNAYEFGMSKGCVTIFLSVIIYSILSCMCSFVMQSVITSMLIGSMGGSGV